jgi:sarcosine oxidase/L-pipecolate oxidase
LISYIPFLHLCFPFLHLGMAASIPADTRSVLIIGSGVFGLSTAWALCKNPLFKDTEITIVDRQPFPAADSSSVRL